MIGKELLDILVCPVCKGELEHDDAVTVLTCPHCRIRYPVEDDIPVMLPEQAEKY